MRALRGALLAACATGGLLGGALPAHAMTLSDEDQQRLRNEDIVVEGQREKKSASSGTKTDVPLIATPQSITVIDQE